MKIVDEFVALLNWRVDDTALRNLEAQARGAAEKLQNIGGALMGAGVALGAVLTVPIVGLGTASVKATADMEMLVTQFEVLTGSQEKALQLKKDLTEMAAETPYETKDLAQSTETLLGFGVALEDTLPIMKQLGDVALGSKDKFSRLTYAFSQMQAMGRLQGQDLLQFINAGFNPLQTISQSTGKSLAQLKKDMEDGLISAQMVKEALIKETSQGGRFFQGMEKGSQALIGLWSTVKDEMHMAFAAIGESFLPQLKSAAKALIGFMKAVHNIADMFKAMPGWLKMMIGIILAIVALIPVLITGVGTLLIGVGAISSAITAISANMVVINTALALTGNLAKAVLLPLLQITVILLGAIFLIGVLSDDFEKWASGGDSAFAPMWNKLKEIKDSIVTIDEFATEMIDNLVQKIYDLMNSPAVKAFTDFFSGKSKNELVASTNGNYNTANQASAFMPNYGAAAGNTFNAGGVVVQVAGSNATPMQISGAARSGSIDAYKQVTRMNNFVERK